MNSNFYNEDLAYVHDVGFRDYVLRAMPEVLAILKLAQIAEGLVVDLGCGTGLSSQMLVEQGFQVLGVDIAPAMIAIAQKRVPEARFQVASHFKTEIPLCCAVLAIGECLNYLGDTDAIAYDQALEDLFQRIYQALCPGGVLVFDGVIPGHVPPGAIAQNFTEGEDWVVLVEKQEEAAILTRRIITFRQAAGTSYRRTEEVHRQCLWNTQTLTQILENTGFQVNLSTAYGAVQLPPARIACIAVKPSGIL